MAFGKRTYDLHRSLAGYCISKFLLAESEHWPAHKMHEYQYMQLLTLLNHCARFVPYYQKTFSEIGFVPERDFKDLSDLKKVSILTKDKARSVWEHLIAANAGHDWVTERTSGSTGAPFEVRISSSQIAFEKAIVWRHWGWAGYKFRARMAIVRTYVPCENGPLIVDDRMRNFRYYSAYHLNEEHALAYLEDIKQFGAEFLRGYPSSLFILADYKEKAGFEMQDLKAVLTASETLTGEQRRKIENAFNARIFDWYGLAEQVVTANECEAHQGLHLNSEYGFWELEKRDYLASNECMIVGTDFRNYAMPLVRYETGDIATVDETTKCPCGRTLPMIRGIAGRKDDIITTPEGARLPAVNFYTLFRDIRSVEGFQVIQWDSNDVEIRLKSPALPDSDKDRIMRELRLRLGSRVKIRLTLNSEFEKNPQGKRRPVMSLVRCEESS